MIGRQRPFLLLTLAVLALRMVGQHVSDPAYAERLSTLLDRRTPVVDVEELAAMPHVVVLDARTKEEFDVSHLRGARWVGYGGSSPELIRDLPKSTPIVVYCSVGYRSGKVTDELRAAGYTNVRNLYGGIFEWVNTGHAVVDAQGPTQRVHTYDEDWGRWLRRGLGVR